MEQAVLVTITLFVGGLIFHAGRLSMRVQHLEEWRGELLSELREIRTTLSDVLRSVRHEEL